MDMLSVENVRKSFGGLPVLKGISLEVRQGEVLAVRRWSQIMSRKRQFMRISKPV